MRKRCICMMALLAMLVMAVLTMGCGGKAFDINAYHETNWAKESADWSKGGYFLYISVDKEAGQAHFNLDFDRGEPNPQNANIYFAKKLSEITDNEVKHHFASDSWGRSGDIELVFEGDKIKYTISNVEDPDGTKWGFSNDQGVFVKNSNALMELTEYNKQHAKAEPAVPTRMTSSKILASIGMTEEEFRNRCIEINEIKYHGTQMLYSELLQYPDKYMNLYCSDHTLYIREKGETTDGYPFYVVESKFGSRWRYHVEVVDMRDNVRAPNLSKGACIKPYMVFRGMNSYNGNDWLIFHMISVDFDGGMKTVY